MSASHKTGMEPAFTTMLGLCVKVGYEMNMYIENISMTLVLHVQYMYMYLYTFFATEKGIIPDNCKHGEIRLVGSTQEYEGNVEVCINGVWSFICDIGWSTNDAKVACTQAGYPGPG